MIESLLFLLTTLFTFCYYPQNRGYILIFIKFNMGSKFLRVILVVAAILFFGKMELDNFNLTMAANQQNSDVAVIAFNCISKNTADSNKAISCQAIKSRYDSCITAANTTDAYKQCLDIFNQNIKPLIK